MKHEDVQDISDLPPLGFFTESAFQRLADWFSKPKGKVAQIEKALSKLELPNSWLRPIDEVLDSAIGTTTWRQLNKDYRNKAISHKTFEAEIFHLVFVKRRVNPDTWDSSFKQFIDAIAPLLIDLQSKVQAVFLARHHDFYLEILRQGKFYLVK